MVKDQNAVYLCGTIMAMNMGGQALGVTVRTTSPRVQGKHDDIRLYFYAKENRDFVYEHFRVGDKVRVNGTIQSSAKYRSWTIAGTEMSRAKRVFEKKFGEGFRQGPVEDDENRVIITGEIINVFTPGSNGKNVPDVVTVRCLNSRGQKSFIQVALFQQRLKTVAHACRVADEKNGRRGDMVAIEGHIQVSRRYDGNRRITEQSVVAQTFRRSGAERAREDTGSNE